ncbi:hypothetical protein [Actinophytocola sp.]|uniref:hypothetical protein n=1 Tax=Actinophytocola sp. TaxID=1872138 RepID=UPI002ED4CCD7
MSEPGPDGGNTRQINPFLIPGREDAPMSALCPWRESSHADLYIEIDNYAPAFADFQAQFTTPSLLMENSRLALVTGDSGCGKSALRNQCAYWLSDQLAANGMRGEIIDLSRAIDLADRKNSVIDINKRITHVATTLVQRMARLDLIDAETRDALAKLPSPELVYADLGTAMDGKGRPDVVLILLLPSADLQSEIEQYATMPAPRVMFFAESSYVGSHQVTSIGGGNDVEVPPATMTVGELSAEDIRLFIETRYEQRRNDGVFPRLDDDVMDLLTSTRKTSVAMLQDTMTGLYNHARRSPDNYTIEATISAHDLTRYSLHKIRSMMG